MPQHATNEVKFVRWPAQADSRTYYRSKGFPCLMVVEAGADPPICHDPREDWVRAPISRTDLEARIAALRRRVYQPRTPVLGPAGTVYFEAKSVTISNTQSALTTLLIARFGEVVYRDELCRQLAEQVTGTPSRNSLDLHIMRLRRRLSLVDLAIRTAGGRGYLLEPRARPA